MNMSTGGHYHGDTNPTQVMHKRVVHRAHSDLPFSRKLFIESR